MNKRQVLVGSMFTLMSAMGSCSTETNVLTHVAQVRLDPARYSIFIAALDAEMSSVGLTRYNAAPSLNAIKGRDVLYANYRYQSSDTEWVLTADDVQKVGVIELRVYSAVLKDEQSRRQAISRLEVVLATFSARLMAHISAVKF